MSCTVNYTSCTWVGMLEILKHTLRMLSWLCCLDGHIRIPPSRKYMKFIHLYRSSSKIMLFLVLKISFAQKFSLFTLSSKYFPLYFMFAWFNFVIFFSLAFVYTCLWILVYLQFTKYGLVRLHRARVLHRAFLSDSFFFVTKKQ